MKEPDHLNTETQTQSHETASYQQFNKLLISSLKLCNMDASLDFLRSFSLSDVNSQLRYIICPNKQVSQITMSSKLKLLNETHFNQNNIFLSFLSLSSNGLCYHLCNILKIMLVKFTLSVINIKSNSKDNSHANELTQSTC